MVAICLGLHVLTWFCLPSFWRGCPSDHLRQCHGLAWDVMAWTHIPHYWPFVRGIHRSSMDSHQHDKKGPVMRSFDIFRFISLSKPLGKKSSCRRFETQWRSYDVIVIHLSAMISLYTHKDFYDTHDLFVKAHYMYIHIFHHLSCVLFIVSFDYGPLSTPLLFYHHIYLHPVNMLLWAVLGTHLKNT